MTKTKNLGLSFVLSLFLLTASIGTVSADKGAVDHSLSVAQETLVVGGDDCHLVEGVGVGLGIAGMLGCIPCEGAAAIIALGVMLAC